MNWDVLPRVGPRDFDPEMIAAWIRPSGAIYDAGFLGGESHPTSARHLTGLDDDVLAVYDVLRSGAMRFTSYELEAGATFVVDPQNTTKTPTTINASNLCHARSRSSIPRTLPRSPPRTQ